MDKTKLRIAAVVLAAVNVVLILINTVMMTGFWISSEMYLEQAYNSKPNGGTEYHADYAGLFILLVPALICAAAAVVLLLSVIRRNKSYGAISVYWFMTAVAVLSLTLYYGSFDSLMKTAVMKNCIISLICFALIGAFILLRRKIGKDALLGMAATAAALVLIFQLILLFEVGFDSFFMVGMALPWFPAVPLLPAAVTALTVLSKKHNSV